MGEIKMTLYSENYLQDGLSGEPSALLCDFMEIVNHVSHSMELLVEQPAVLEQPMKCGAMGKRSMKFVKNICF